MKRLIFIFFLCTTFVCSMFAKDVIITHDAEKINAIVTEVSETEVKYKKVDNPNGPTFVIATSKIASIMYQNGEVQTFKEAAQPATPQNAQAVQYYNTQPTYDIWGNADYGAALGAINANNIQFIPGQSIVKTANGYGYGNVHMDENTYGAFVKRTCPAAAQLYDKGATEVKIGAGCVGASLGLLVGLCIVELAFVSSYEPWLDTYALAIGIPSLACAAVGVPLWIVGANNVKKSVNVFNTQCGQSQNPPITVSLNASQNGIGLALNF